MVRIQHYLPRLGRSKVKAMVVALRARLIVAYLGRLIRGHHQKRRQRQRGEEGSPGPLPGRPFVNFPKGLDPGDPPFRYPRTLHPPQEDGESFLRSLHGGSSGTEGCSAALSVDGGRTAACTRSSVNSNHRPIFGHLIPADWIP